MDRRPRRPPGDRIENRERMSDDVMWVRSPGSPVMRIEDLMLHYATIRRAYQV
jgi:hypothetical protein